MKHPTQEEWMEHLYGESTPGRRAELAEHSRQCAECRNLLAKWDSARTSLDEWRLGSLAQGAGLFRSRVAWGLAAAVTFLLGVGASQLASARANDPAKVARLIAPALRAEAEALAKKAVAAESARIERALRDRLDEQIAAASLRASQETERLLARLDDSWNESRATDQAEIAGLLRSMETDQLARFASMRKDLETVAITGESKLQDAQQEIGQLASLSQTVYHDKPAVH
jgi:hypothetical protein